MRKRELGLVLPEAHLAGELPATPAPRKRAAASLLSAAARLSAANVVVFASGLVTGPLLAHALGATGRGQLASIVVPVTVLGWLAGLGLNSWVTVETAQGRPLGEVLGTSGLLSLGLGVAATVAALPLATVLANGSRTVEVFIFIGGAMMPVSLFVQLLLSAAVGRSEWAMASRSRSVPSLVSLGVTAGLFVTGTLTLATAAAVFAVGGGLSIIPLIRLVRKARPFRFSGMLAKTALAFGLRAWANNLGSLVNARLDQLLMIPLVPAEQLGLYAVAVTYSGLPAIVSGALPIIIAPRLATGDHVLVGRSLRVTIAFMSVSAAALALVAPFLLPVAFGPDFAKAVDMAWILLLAGVPLAGTGVLTAALTYVGQPGLPAIGQLIAAGLTAVGLAIVLPTLQAVGAALVSLGAYSLALLFLLVGTARHLDTSVWTLLRPTRADLAWAASLLRVVRTRIAARAGSKGAS